MGREGRPLVARDRDPVRRGTNPCEIEHGRRPHRGDALQPGAPDLWKAVVQQSQPHPIPLIWRIEALDERGQIVGVSESRRLLVFNVH